MNLPRRTPIALLGALLLVVVGCTDDGDEPLGADDSADTGTDDGDPDPDDPEQYECAPDDLEVCPPETKCTAIIAADGLSFSYECVADVGELAPGEVCEPSPPTGVDGCPSGYACIPDRNVVPSEGHCLRLCLDDGGCLEGLCAATPTSPAPVCLATCDPLLATCPDTHACRYLESRAFACVIPLPDDLGVQGAQCDGINQRGCAGGFVCMASQQVPDCFDSDFCCTAICPVEGGAECPGAATCQSLGLEAPELGNVGACSL